MLVFLTDVPGAYLIAHHKDWPILLPIIVALLPLAASLLYIRDILRWIRGMDELHRQITLASFGFATAMDIATEAIDRLHSTAHSHHRIIVVELMGNRSGWLALGAGIAGGADVILIPEIPYNEETIA